MKAGFIVWVCTACEDVCGAGKVGGNEFGLVAGLEGVAVVGVNFVRRIMHTGMRF